MIRLIRNKEELNLTLLLAISLIRKKATDFAVPFENPKCPSKKLLFFDKIFLDFLKTFNFYGTLFLKIKKSRNVENI